jgi:hypothetical protein
MGNLCLRFASFCPGRAIGRHSNPHNLQIRERTPEIWSDWQRRVKSIFRVWQSILAAVRAIHRIACFDLVRVPKGRKQISPGQRPGDVFRPHASPERAAQPRALTRRRMFRPFRAWPWGGARVPGALPRAGLSPPLSGLKRPGPRTLRALGRKSCQTPFLTFFTFRLRTPPNAIGWMLGCDGSDDRRGTRSCDEQAEPRPRRKVWTPQGAVVGNAHRPVTRVGTVPQKTNRLGEPSGSSR